MPPKPKPDPEKYCKRCGSRLHRHRYGKNLEDMTRFLKREYCSLHCANSRGIRSKTFTAQHVISRPYRKERCESCGKDKYLHVHHVNFDWMDHSPENLKTLCVACHLNLHKPKSKPCLVCGEISRGRNLCQKHLVRLRKYGSPFLTRVHEKGVPAKFRMVLDLPKHGKDTRWPEEWLDARDF